jgi:hypothetical protein
MSGEGFLVWHTVCFWSLVCAGLASASITFESLNCVNFLGPEGDTVTVDEQLLNY